MTTLKEWGITAPTAILAQKRRPSRTSTHPSEGFTPDELRHTAASLAIAAGANVKMVQRMLGHKSATQTLDRYGHLFRTSSAR